MQSREAFITSYACRGGCTLHTNPAATQQLCSHITKPDVGNGPGLLGYVP